MITQTVTITQNATPNIIIGRRGTYETKQVIFDVSWLRSSYGEGTATLLVKRPTDVTAYPVAATLDGTTLTWTVSDTDTSYKGHGECEIFWYVNGGLAKSCICGVTILRDIGDTTETAPDPYETWIETLTALGSETLANAQSAAQSASDANQSAEDASNSAAAALESEENALNSENAAKASEQAAAASEANALASEQAAKASENAAALSEGNARQSANAAYQSAGIAANSATQAATSASEAQGYVSEASVQADRAEQAADNIESNVQRAEAAAQSAQNAASDANGFAGAASTKATEAAASASSASSSAVAATQKASDASASATAAASSATAANTAKAAAETAQGKAEDAQEAAETAATNAQASADDAAQSAQEAAREIIKAFPHDTATGSIANFPDGAALPVRDLSVDIEPVQDLNGYDNPWPAGAMGNLLPLSGNMTKTNNGVSATLENGIITLSGTASGNAVIVFDLETAISILPDNYKIALFNSANSSSVFFRTQDGSTTLHNFACSSVNRVVTSWTVQGAEHTTAVGVQVSNGVNVDGMSLKPMVVSQTKSDPTTFYPYSNICPISGWTGAKVTRTGKNLLEVESRTIAESQGDSTIRTETCKATKSGDVLSATITGAWSKLRLYNSAWHFKHGNTYTISAYFDNPSGNRVGIGYLKLGVSSSQWTNSSMVQTSGKVSMSFTYDDSWGDMIIAFIVNNTNSSTNNSVTVSEMMIELSSTATAYEPYNGTTYSITFPTEAGTVYGGTLDVTTGKLTVDRAMVDLGTLDWTKAATTSYWWFSAKRTDAKKAPSNNEPANCICSAYKALSPNALWGGSTGVGINFATDHIIAVDISYEDATSFKTAMSGVQLVYELATPIVYDLTPTEVSTLLGTNNVWADTGDTTVDYYGDPTLYINKKIAAAVAAMS